MVSSDVPRVSFSIVLRSNLRSLFPDVNSFSVHTFSCINMFLLLFQYYDLLHTLFNVNMHDLIHSSAISILMDICLIPISQFFCIILTLRYPHLLFFHITLILRKSCLHICIRIMSYISLNLFFPIHILFLFYIIISLSIISSIISILVSKLSFPFEELMQLPIVEAYLRIIFCKDLLHWPLSIVPHYDRMLALIDESLSAANGLLENLSRGRNLSYDHVDTSIALNLRRSLDV